jgi:glycosyltransferase involved in cell wall biosynthesis
VVTVHDAVPWTHPETLTPRGVAWHRTVIARAAATADLIVVPTRAVAVELDRHLAMRDVLVVGEGVSPDLAVPADADERAARLALPERYLLTVATLEPRKGLRELAAALDGSLPLLCAGQQGWGEAPAGARVLGRVSDEDLAVLMSRATALVVPSYDEGFGLPLLEGMSLGTPVLTSDAPALVEVAGGASLAVPLADLRDGIRQITTDETLRQRLRAEGPRRAAAFSWVNAAETLWRAYADLLRDHP